MKIIPIFLMGVSLFFWGCSAQENSGGPSSTETQNALTGTALLANGQPGDSIEFTVYDASKKLSESQIFQGQTDSNGQYSTLLDTATQYSILFKKSTLEQARLLIHSDSLENNPISKLGTPLPFEFNISGMDSTLPSNVAVFGSSIQQNLGNAGSYSLSIPSAGEYQIQVEQLGVINQYNLRIDSNQLSQTVQWDSSAHFSLGSFESGCARNDLATLVGRSYWWSVHKNYTATPSNIFDDIESACAQDTEKGLVLQASYISNGQNPSYFIIGTNLGKRDLGIDLSSLEKIKIELKGEGDIELFLGAIHPSQDTTITFRFPKITLTPDWMYHEVYTKDLEQVYWDTRGTEFFEWDELNHQIEILQVMADQTGSLAINDISLYGTPVIINEY
ncbi:hypothetical protein OAU52_01125 [bacterium]|nr:hypothetical protein [bacterium]